MKKGLTDVLVVNVTETMDVVVVVVVVRGMLLEMQEQAWEMADGRRSAKAAGLGCTVVAAAAALFCRTVTSGV